VSTKLFYLVLDLGDELERPLAAVPAALLEAMAPVFLSRTIWVLVDGEHELQIERMSSGQIGKQRLWAAEAWSAGEVLTECSLRDDGIVADLRDALAPLTARSVFMRAEGALRFHTSGSPEPRWYGRWYVQEPPCLLDLVTVRFEWTAEARTVELSLGCSGYPLTSSDLRLDGSLGDGAPEIAAANRELMFQTLARLPGAIGVPAGGARWSDDGDYGYLYGVDAKDIRSRWLPWLESFVRDLPAAKGDE
jgi:hypothetical protein